MVQLAPTARVAPQVPPALRGLREWLRRAAGKCKGSARQSRVSGMVTVRVSAWLIVPLPSSQIERVRVTDARCVATAPVPVNDTGEPVTAALEVMVTVPTAGPVDVGESTTLIVQVPANTVNVAPQVPPAAPTGRRTEPLRRH